MYRIAICEDEPLMARENEGMLCRILENRRLRRDVDYDIDVFFAAEPLRAVLREHPGAFQLLLLDIKLAGESGMDLAAWLRELDIACSIIYITSYEEYMPRSFATRPLDYLMKPVDEKKLAEAVDWDLRKNYRPEVVVLPVNGGWRRVKARDILYAEATSHKSAVHLTEETFYVNQTFRDLLSRLRGGDFCRCHNSIVVNLNHVYRRTNRRLLLDNGCELPVSRTYQKEIARQFVAFTE